MQLVLADSRQKKGTTIGATFIVCHGHFYRWQSGAYLIYSVPGTKSTYLVCTVQTHVDVPYLTSSEVSVHTVDGGE